MKIKPMNVANTTISNTNNMTPMSKNTQVNTNTATNQALANQQSINTRLANSQRNVALRQQANNANMKLLQSNVLPLRERARLTKAVVKQNIKNINQDNRLHAKIEKARNNVGLFQEKSLRGIESNKRAKILMAREIGRQANVALGQVMSSIAPGQIISALSARDRNKILNSSSKDNKKDHEDTKPTDTTTKEEKKNKPGGNKTQVSPLGSLMKF